jgi:demethylmenaquinone methyltransferase/2-methoxy-6-polyprenyl-1,4-benzoquinol methylase/phosphoethanolamine N-methyltransferase
MPFFEQGSRWTMADHVTHGVPHTHGSVIRWARSYDLLTRLVGAGPKSKSRREVIRNANLRAGESVLDVGCGPGVLTLMAAEAVGPSGLAQGIDPSPGMVELAREKASKAGASNAQFRMAVIEELPFADSSFDAALSSLMLHHLPDDVKRAGFTEVFRVLKPGGRLIAFDLTGKGWMWKVLSIVGHRLPAVYDRELAQMMIDAGFAAEILASDKRFLTIRATKPG